MLKQILIALDQLFNTLVPIGGMGWADEAFSSRCWRLRNDSRFYDFMRRLIDAVFFWQDNHCKQAFGRERERAQMPPELRG